METSQNLQEMSSWTTSCMVGCSRTAPQKIKKHLKVCSDKLVARGVEKKKKDHISLIPGKNETKSKDSGCSFLVSFLLLLPPRDDGKGGFKQETIKLSDLGLAVKLGKRGHVKGDSSAWMPCTMTVFMHCGGLRCFSEAFRAQHHTCLQRCWQEALLNQFESTLIQVVVGSGQAENYFVYIYTLFSPTWRDDPAWQSFSTGCFNHHLVMPLVPHKSSDSTTMPWRWSKFRPKFFNTKRWGENARAKTKSISWQIVASCGPPPSSFQTSQDKFISSPPGHDALGVFFSGLGAIYVSIFQTFVGKCEPGKRYNTSNRCLVLCFYCVTWLNWMFGSWMDCFVSTSDSRCWHLSIERCPFSIFMANSRYVILYGDVPYCPSQPTAASVKKARERKEWENLKTVCRKPGIIFHHPVCGDQTMQIYGKFNGFHKKCIVWSGNI